jgi:hypothetical protein
MWRGLSSWAILVYLVYLNARWGSSLVGIALHADW